MERSATQSWTGTLANEGEFTYVFATLAPNQIVNASLKCPKNANLNYDLFIYTVDASGTLGQMVGGSTTDTYMNFYYNGDYTTVDEGASYVNRTSGTNDYAIIVSATKGGSTTDTFKLTVSIDVAGNYDAAEPNDSVYNAYAVALGSAISGPTLHVVNDQDWYAMNASSDYSAAKIYVEAASANYNVEVYTAEENKLVLHKPRSDGAYSIYPGVYFIRVFAKETNFVPQAYTLSLTALSYSGESTEHITELISYGKYGKWYPMTIPPNGYVLDFTMNEGPRRFVLKTSFIEDGPAEWEEIFEESTHPFTYVAYPLHSFGMQRLYVAFFNDTLGSTSAWFDVTVNIKYYPQE